MRRILEVQIRTGFCFDLIFDDGLRGILDLSDLAGEGIMIIGFKRSFRGLLRSNSRSRRAGGTYFVLFLGGQVILHDPDFGVVGSDRIEGYGLAVRMEGDAVDARHFQVDLNHVFAFK
jgi:hypothetical protein